MALATLLVPGEPRTFVFEHAQAHRSHLGAMAPLSGYSVVPYLFDPAQNNSPFNLNHNQAHSDTYSGLGGVSRGAGYAKQLPVPFPHNFIDNDLRKKGQLSWWVFTNHLGHYTTQANIPLTNRLSYPFA